MNDGPLQRRPEARLDALERAVASLEARLAAIETSADDRIDGRSPERPHDRSPERLALLSPGVASPLQQRERFGQEREPFRRAIDPATILTLAGRTLMVLGGAYLLRALTESAVWPVWFGVTAGFVYAASSLVATSRAARANRSLSAQFHGATAVMIALPLLWEAVTRFRLLDAIGASLLLAVLVLATLAVAARARLQPVAWLATIGFVVSSVALTAATSVVLPFAVADIVVGVATLWIGYTVDWIWLRWPVALVADVAVVALGVGAATGTASSGPAVIVAVQLLLLGGYVASVAIRTLLRGREVIPFEAIQSTVALVVGFGGAIQVAQTTGSGTRLLVSIAVASGVGCYGVAFAFIARRQGVRRNFWFYTSMALVLIVGGTAIGVPYPALWWAVLAVAAATVAAARVHRADAGRRAAAPGATTLTVHAAAYLVAAVFTSGLMAISARALIGPPITQSPLSPQPLAVFIGGCVCWLVLARGDADTRSEYARLPRAAIALVLAVAGGAWLAALVVSDGTAAGQAATVRTIALAVTALGLAWVGRSPRRREASWLVYPTLALGGVKLLAEDFPHSSAATLFVALAMYGAALIAAPRLIRRATD
jgi:hypothetical protein